MHLHPWQRRRQQCIPSSPSFFLLIGRSITLLVQTQNPSTIPTQDAWNHALVNHTESAGVPPKDRITESQNGRGWKGPLWVI